MTPDFLAEQDRTGSNERLLRKKSLQLLEHLLDENRPGFRKDVKEAMVWLHHHQPNWDATMHHYFSLTQKR